MSTVDLEQRVHALVNAEREKQGLSTLAWDEALAAVCRKHSQDMANRGYFSHISPEGEGPLERCKEEGYDPRKIATGDYQYRLGCAENLFQGNVEERKWYSGAFIPTRTTTLWRNLPRRPWRVGWIAPDTGRTSLPITGSLRGSVSSSRLMAGCT
ncbi:MAG: CAP domain-containing protein [Chloroflexi bacterium]|nr:CAP domain-containing protein [Chloroflexota bacterium]